MSGSLTSSTLSRRAKLSVAFALCLVSSIALSQNPEAIPLRVGEVLSGTLGTDQSAAYVFEGDQDSTYLVEVEQRGLDFTLTVLSGDGTKRVYNSPLGRDEREFVLIDRAEPGPYRVEIHSDEYTAAVGEYSIRFSDLPDDSTSERQEIAAWVLMTRAALVQVEATDEVLNEAVGAYESAARLWSQLGQPRREACALFGAASIEYQLERYSPSVRLAAMAADRYAKAGQDLLRASALHKQAAALIELANSGLPTDVASGLFTDAIDLFDEAKAVFNAAGRTYDVGLVTNNLFLAHYYMGNLREARSYAEQAAAIFESLNEWSAEVNPLQNQAVIDAEEGNLSHAVESLSRILQVLPTDRLSDYRALILDNLATSHRRLGNLDRALELFNRALELHNELNDREGEAQSLRGIGLTYLSFGYLDLAREVLLQALPIAKEKNDGRTQQALETSLANIAYLQRDYEGALRGHVSAFGLAKSELDVAYLHIALARDLIALERYDEGLQRAREAYAAMKAAGVRRLEAQALEQVGIAQSGLGQGDSALESLRSALAIYATLGLDAEKASALHGLALVQRARGELESAGRYGESALTTLEALRVRVADPELRAFHSAMRRDFFSDQIETLMALAAESGNERYAKMAFATSERSRARMMVDLMSEASIDARDADPVLAGRQAELYRKLADARYRRDKLLAVTSPSRAQQAALTSLVQDMTSLENELKLVETDLQRSHPDAASPDKPTTLDAAGIRASLDPDTALLQYALGPDKSFAWVVTSETITAYSLAAGGEIETAARDAHRLIQDVQSRDSNASELRTVLEKLSAMVLAPLADSLDTSRLLVSADGALQYIPFALLPLRVDDPAGRLVNRREIVMVPSVSAVTEQRSHGVARPRTKDVAVFADPVLERSDKRLTGKGGSSARLPYSGEEAEEIAKLVSENRRTLMVGFDANRRAVVEADLGDYRIIHFATHGSIDTRYPGLSALELSRFDHDGRPLDGSLRMHDIFGLKLNADVVVLSACETALGREIGGEGLFGFGHAFMYAGAKSLVASLWRVSDRATAEFMSRFYDAMLNKHLRPAAALREAQLELAATTRWKDPFDWSGFILLGEWR